TTVANALPPSRFIDKNSAHCLPSGSKKVRPILPRGLSVSAKAHPCFVHECGGLECVARCFLSHLDRGEFAEFVVNEREQFFRCFGIALLNPVEDACEVAHTARLGRGVLDVEIENSTLDGLTLSLLSSAGVRR